MWVTTRIRCYVFLVILNIQPCFNDGSVEVGGGNGSDIWFQNEDNFVYFNNSRLDDYITNMMRPNFNYSSYNHAITKTVGQISHHNHPNVVLFVNTDCSTDYIIALITSLKTIRKTALCYYLQNDDRHIFEDGIEYIHYSFISTAILLLPWYLTEGLLKMVPPTYMGHVTFILVEMLPIVMDSFREKNIFLKVINVETVSRNSLSSEKNVTVSQRLSPSFCTMIEKCGDYNELSNKRACYKQNDYVVRVVSLLYERYVFIIPGQRPINEQCVGGLPCKVPIKNGNSTTTWKWVCCGGVYVEIFLLLFREMDLAYEFYIVEDSNFGAVDKNGIWNGMIGDLYRGHADLAVQQVTVLTQRFKVIDYTYRIITQRIPLGIVIRNLNSKFVVVNWSFVKSLTTDLLVALCIGTLIILVLVFTLENIGYLLKYDRRYPFRESFSHINGVLFQRDLGAVLPRRWPGQIVSIVYAFGMTVTIGTYTAQLTAKNLGLDEEEKFKGFQDAMFQDPSFKVGVQGSSSYEYFLDKQKDINVRKIVINNWKEGIEMVYNKTLDAFVGQSNSLESMISSNNLFCEELLLYREYEFSEDMAFAVQKGSILGDRISASILRYTENGLLEHIIKKWRHINSCHIWHTTRFHRYPWEYMGGLTVILMGTVGVCIGILFLEHFYTYWTSRRRKGYDMDRSEKDPEIISMKESSFTNPVIFSH